MSEQRPIHTSFCNDGIEDGTGTAHVCAGECTEAERVAQAERIAELEAENQHLANNLDIACMGRVTAEATIARVIEGAQMLVESFQRVERGGNHLYDASTHRCADNLALLLAEAQGPEHVRAALEGEQS